MLNVLEVDHFTSADKLVVQTDYFTVRVRPIAVSEVRRHIIDCSSQLMLSTDCVSLLVMND